MKIDYECKKCGVEFTVDVSPIIPAKTWGPPERCHPEEGGEIEPEECDCGEPVDCEVCWRKIEYIGDSIDENNY